MTILISPVQSRLEMEQILSLQRENSPNVLSIKEMEQVCIQKEYRKMGVFQNLYKKMEDVIKTNYTCIITEVDGLNKRSLNAHFAVGFIELKTYYYNGRKWHLLALK